MKWIFLLFLIVSCGQSEEALITDGVEPYEHRIFVTSGTIQANFGTLESADALCESEAQSAGLVRSYKAIISNTSYDAKERIRLYGKVYNVDASLNAIKVVDQPEDLWRAFTKSLLSPVNLDANGGIVSGYAWTGSYSEGSRSDDNHCSNWSSTSSSLDGQAGVIGSTSSTWLEDLSVESCSESFHLYCISQ